MYKDKQKQLQYQKTWLKARRDAYFKGKFCVICGSSSNLELDHIDRSTKVSHSIWSWTKQRQELELKKCQILCKSCHRQKTNQENRKPITHGNSGYDKFCRCNVCTKAHSERMKLRIR